MKARVFENEDDWEKETQAGDICPIDGGVLIRCPGCARPSVIPEKEDHKVVNWSRGWDYDATNVSLVPSVHHQQGCGWHGHLKNGEWVPC